MKPAVRSFGNPRSSAGAGYQSTHSIEAMGGSPHESPGRSRSPLMFAPQRTSDAHPAFRQHWIKDPYVAFDTSFGKGVPMMITWNYGGKSILVEGSWDNWSSRKPLTQLGKDHSIFLLLPPGIYQYRFIVDDQWRYSPELPFCC